MHCNYGGAIGINCHEELQTANNPQNSCLFAFSFVSGLSWVVGDAEELPFDDDQFDIYTIAFGIRNVTHIDQVSYF